MTATVIRLPVRAPLPAWDDPASDWDDDDPLSPARGILIGCAIGFTTYLGGGLIYLAYIVVRGLLS